jgi:hypothetical protein
MQPESFLDEFVGRFRHRWHTDSQYRAMMSGVFAVVVLVSLCLCAGITSTVANNVFYGAGLASSGSQDPNAAPTSGTLQGFASFPTASLPPWTPGAIPPPNPAPVSQTPIPTATSLPTATPVPGDTPCTSSCGGGGGGGQKATVTVTWSPATWTGGFMVVNVHTSVPNDGVNLLIKNCAGGTVLNNGNGVTDSNGDYTFTFPIAEPGPPYTLKHATINAQDQTGGSGFAYPPCA